MHDGVGEVFLSLLLKKMEELTPRPNELEALELEVRASLHCSWVSGLLSSLCDDFLNSQVVKNFVVAAIDERVSNMNIVSQNEIVEFQNYQALKVLFLEEMIALKALINGEGDFADSPRIYSLTDRRWVVA
jgi:hypothetical protein